MRENIYKNIRKAFQLTQNEMAEKLGISQGYLSSVENSESMPGGEIVLLVMKYFNVRGEYLLSGKGEMFESEVSESTTENEKNISSKGIQDNKETLSLKDLIVLENNLTASLRIVKETLKRRGYKEDSVERVDIDLDDLVKIKMLAPQPKDAEHKVK